MYGTTTVIKSDTLQRFHLNEETFNKDKKYIEQSIYDDLIFTNANKKY